MVEFYRVKQKSGLTILFEKRDLPIVAIMAATMAGAAYETAKNKGIAHFTEHVLYKGTEKRTAKEISSAIEKVGGILNAFTAEQATGFYLKIPSKHFDIGIDIILDCIKNAKFTVKDIERERGVILAEIDRFHDLPQNYLFEKVKEFLYSRPFNLSIAGLKETVSKFKRKDFSDWQKYYCPENLIVSIVGSANLKEIDEISKKYFEKKKGTKIPKANIKPLSKNSNLLEKRDGLEQTHFALGFHSPSLSNKMRYDNWN